MALAHIGWCNGPIQHHELPIQPRTYLPGEIAAHVSLSGYYQVSREEVPTQEETEQCAPPPSPGSGLASSPPLVRY